MERQKEIKSKAKYEYDFVEDIIYIVPNKRDYSSSFRIESLVFDLNKDKKLVGLEILNASKLMKIQKIFLARVFNGTLELKVQKDKISIMLEVMAVFRNQRLRNTMEMMERIQKNELSPSLTNFDLTPNVPLPQMVGG
jgi:uncharacterized protein YuzE